MIEMAKFGDRQTPDVAVPFTPTGGTREEIAGSLYDYEPPTTRSMTTGVNPRGGLYPIDTVVPGAETQEELRDRILGTDWRLNRPDVANQYIHGTVGTHGWDDRDKFIEWAVDKESGKLAQYLPEDQQPVSGEDAADVVSTSETPTTVVNSTGGTSNENLAFDLGQKNAGRLMSALQARPNGNSAAAANVSPLQRNQPLSYLNLAEKIIALKRPKGADLSEVRKALLGQKTALETLQQNWPDKPTINYKEHALDYGRLITEQESRARKIREDAKKSAGAQALIHLGAGIAEGDLAKGLRGAAESASETTRLGRQEATAEERLARTMQIAEAESNMDLGIRQQESALAQYENDRTRALEELGIEGKIITDQVGLEMKAAEMKYAETVAAYEAKRNQFISAAQMLRYGDLAGDPMEDLFREAMRAGADYIKIAMDDYKDSPEGYKATPKDLTNYMNMIMDNVLATYGGKHPEAIAARKRQKALATSDGTTPPVPVSVGKNIGRFKQVKSNNPLGGTS